MNQVKLMCAFEATFDIPPHIDVDSEEFDEFIDECLESDEMLSQEVTDSGVVAICIDGRWQ